jgi:hypothetical protein
MPSKIGSSCARNVGSSLHALQKGAGDGVGRIERETARDRGLRLVNSTKLRKGGGHSTDPDSSIR